MSKVVMWAIGAIVVVAVGVGIYWVMNVDDSGNVNTETVQTGDQADAGATKTACDIFTLDIAKTVLGEGARKGELPAGAEASTDDVSVSNCLFEADQGQALIVANILVRGAKNTEGRSGNEFGFNGNQDRSSFEGEIEAEFAPTEPISGLGDAAFYDPDFEQVNVLVNGGQYWVIVQADGGREKVEQLAGAVVENL